MNKHDFVSKMESCRSGSNDHTLPEMQPLAEHLQSDEEARRLFDRCQAFDADLKAAVLQPPAPEHLEQSLLEAVAVTVAAAEANKATLQRGVAISKWQWSLAVSAVLAFFVVGISWWMATDQQRVVSEEELAQQAVVWLEHVVGSERWRALAREPASTQTPARFLRVDLTHAQHAPNAWSRATVAYRLNGAGRENAYLFVLKTSRVVKGLGVGPPRRERLLSGGGRMAAWQQGNLLFVLVFRGESGRYQRIVKTNRTSA